MDHYEKPKVDVCEFRGDSSYLSSFLYSLYKPTKNNADIKKFLPMAKNYVGEVPPATAKILNDPLKDEDTVVRLSRQKMTDRRTTLLNNKLHLINNILIRYGYFLEVYTIQKKFKYLNIGDQEKMKRKQELTSCAHPQFNSMHTIRSIFHNTVRKEYKPVYIFIDCSVSMKHFGNFCFYIDPRSAFIGHYSDERRNTKRNPAYQCRY